MAIGKELELFGISLEEASEAPPQEKSSRAGKTNNSFPRFMETIMKKGKNYAISLGGFESFCFRLRWQPTGCKHLLYKTNLPEKRGIVGIFFLDLSFSFPRYLGLS